MEIIRFQSKDKIKIKPYFFTANITQSEVMGFRPDQEYDSEKVPFRFSLWEIFLREFFFSFYTAGYQIVFYVGMDIKNDLTKYQTNRFIFHNEDISSYYGGTYFSINQGENEAFRQMALFEFFWALNDYTILIFSPKFIVDNQTLHHIANGGYPSELLLAEIRIGEDGEFAECIYAPEISAAVDCAYERALRKMKVYMKVNDSKEPSF